MGRGINLIIFDLEGVLIDNRKRYLYALRKANPFAKSDKELSRSEKRIFWETFFDPSLSDRLDKVNLVALKLLDKYVREGKKVIILSGTKKKIVNILIKKLRRVAKDKGLRFEPALIIWRGDKDFRKSPIFKLSKVRELEKILNEEVEEIHDDDIEIVNEFRKKGINAVLWVDLKPKNRSILDSIIKHF